MKTSSILLSCIVLIVVTGNVYSQVSISKDSTPPHESAILHLKSDSLGLLIPIMTQTQRLSISNPTDGLIVYQYDPTEGIYYYDGNYWIILRSGTIGNIWADGGDFLSPVRSGALIRVADTTSYTYGIYANMNTGANYGYGGYFQHTNSSGEGTGIYAKALYTGTGTSYSIRGAEIESVSTTQNQVGIRSNHQHSGVTGSLMGIYNTTEMTSGNNTILYGTHSYSVRHGNESDNYGVYGRADTGLHTYGVAGQGEDGTYNYGVDGRGIGGTLAYGVYGDASGATENYGVFGKSPDWGGYFKNSVSSNKEVKLGGSVYAIQIIDGNQLAGRVLTCDNQGNAAWQENPPTLPAGDQGSVQYKNSSSFAGASDFIWDNTNKRLGIGTSSLANTLEVNGNINIKGIVNGIKMGDDVIIHMAGITTNIMLGSDAGAVAYKSANGTFVGYEAGRWDTTGQDNTFVGSKAGYWSRSSHYNTYLGSSAGYNNTIGDYNTFLGYSAGITGNNSRYNTMIGAHAGHSTTSGRDNVYVGYNAGYDNTTGSQNTFIGSQAGENNYQRTGSVFIGYKAGYNESSFYRLYIHNNESSNPLIYGEFDNEILRFNGQVGIQTTPRADAGLHVEHDSLYAGYFTSDNHSNNTHVIHAEYTSTSLADAVAVYGKCAPGANAYYGIGGQFIGNFKGVDISSNAGSSTGTSYGLYAKCSGFGGPRYGVYGEASNGTFRYGVYGKADSELSQSYAVFCDGNGVYSGTWNSTSDSKLKENLKDVTGILDQVMQLSPKSYNFKTKKYDYVNLAWGNHYGFTAQDMEEVFPDLVGTASVPKSDDKDPVMEEFKTVNYIELIPILTGAIQEQQEMIMEMKKEIEELKAEVRRK